MATDWQSFDEYMALSGDELRRLEQEAIDRATQAEADGRAALFRAESESMTTGRELAQTQSFGEYQAAKTGLRAAMQRRPLNAREASATRSLGLQQPTGGLERLAAEERAAAPRGVGFYEAQQAEQARMRAEKQRQTQRDMAQAQRFRAKQELDAAQRAAVTQGATRGVQRVYEGTRLAITPAEERLRKAREAYQALPPEEMD